MKATFSKFALLLTMVLIIDSQHSLMAMAPRPTMQEVYAAQQKKKGLKAKVSGWINQRIAASKEKKELKKKLKPVEAYLTVGISGKRVTAEQLTGKKASEIQTFTSMPKRDGSGQLIFDSNDNQIFRRAYRYKSCLSKDCNKFIIYQIIIDTDENGKWLTWPVAHFKDANGITREIEIWEDEVPQIGYSDISMYSLANYGLNKKGSELLKQASMASYSSFPSVSEASTASTFSEYQTGLPQKVGQTSSFEEFPQQKIGQTPSSESVGEYQVE